MKMKFSLCFISLITVYILPITYSHGSRKVPGSISCGYFGALEESCGKPTVSATDLPKEVESVIYNGITPDASLNVAFDDSTKMNDEHLKSLLSTGKSVFLLYHHVDDNELLNVISSNSQDGGKNAKTEMANLKKFLEPYKNIAGLSVFNLKSSASSTTTASLTENFKIYIDEMRNCFPGYGIGLSIYAMKILDIFAESNPVWFDICVLDPSIDFYIIDVYNINNCTEDFKVGGSIPINGTAQHTLDKVNDLLAKLGIPNKKRYYLYRATATSVHPVSSTCGVTNEMVCTQLSSLDGYCMDTTQTFFDKGAFAKKNGAGVIVADVDLDDDPHGCCQCSPYPAYQRILAGYKGESVPPVCPLIDKR